MSTLYSLCFDSRTPKFFSIYENYIRNNCNLTGSVLTLQPVASTNFEMYFEVTVEEFSGSNICIGFVAGNHNCYQLPGEKAGIGVRSDGKLLDGSSGALGVEWAGCSSWGLPGDTIGLGINIISGDDYFNEDEPLYPVVALSGKGCVSVNFGSAPFRFPAHERLQDLQKARREELNEKPASDMVIRGIVEDYLLYHGFGQTYDMILTDAVDQEKSKGKECFSKHHVPPGSTRETVDPDLTRVNLDTCNRGGCLQRGSKSAECDIGTERFVFDDLVALFDSENSCVSRPTSVEVTQQVCETKRNDSDYNRKTRSSRQKKSRKVSFKASAKGLNIRNAVLSPSDAGILKYLTYIKINASNDVFESIKLNGTDVNILEMISKRSQTAFTGSEENIALPNHPVMSFPVIVDVEDNQSKEDDVYISTLKFRSYSRSLIRMGCLREVKKLLATLLPESLYCFTPVNKMESNSISSEVTVGSASFSEVWVMIQCLECVQYLSTEGTVRAIEFSKKCLFPLLVYSDGSCSPNDYNISVRVTDFEHEKNIFAYINQYLASSYSENPTDTGHDRKRNREASIPAELPMRFPCSDLTSHKERINTIVSSGFSSHECGAVSVVRSALKCWKERGIVSIVLCTFSLLSYDIDIVDLSTIIECFRAALANALNEKILSCCIDLIERRESDLYASGRSGLSGVRIFGTALEACLLKLAQLLDVVEKCESNEHRASKDVFDSGAPADRKQEELRSTTARYGNGSLLTFKDERDHIYHLLCRDLLIPMSRNASIENCATSKLQPTSLH